jgi:predicted nuclease of predicted toxin-antitoxin system
MWLLDANMPKKVVALLGEFGIDAATAESRGWEGLTNGELVAAAAAAGFTSILTRDKLFGESAAKALRRFSHFSIVLVTLPQLRGEQFIREFRLAWQHTPIRPEPGALVSWPAAESAR